MSNNWDELLEHAIVGRLIACLLDDGFRLEVSDKAGGGLHIYGAPDGGPLPKECYSYAVRRALQGAPRVRFNGRPDGRREIDRTADHRTATARAQGAFPLAIHARPPIQRRAMKGD